MLCCLSTLSIQRSKHVMHSMLYVEAVDTKHIHTFLPITFLIFNRFSICKKFWKAETEGFSTIPSNTIYVDTVGTRQGSLMHSMLCMLTCQYKTHLHISPYNFLNIQPISICKKFWKAETEGFSTIPSNTIYVDTVDTRHKYF